MLSVSLSVELMRQGKIYNIDIYMRDFPNIAKDKQAPILGFFRQGKGNRIWREITSKMSTTTTMI